MRWLAELPSGISRPGHDLIPRPRGGGWCLCRQPTCPGWTAYAAWHHQNSGRQPDAADIGFDKVFLAVLAGVVDPYNDKPVTGTSLDAAIEQHVRSQRPPHTIASARNAPSTS